MNKYFAIILGLGAVPLLKKKMIPALVFHSIIVASQSVHRQLEIELFKTTLIGVLPLQIWEKLDEMFQ